MRARLRFSRHIANERSVKVSPFILFPLDLAREIFEEKDENASGLEAETHPFWARRASSLTEAKVNRETAIRRRFIRNFGIRD